MTTRTKLEREIRSQMQTTYGLRIHELEQKLAAFRETNETLEQRVAAAEARESTMRGLLRECKHVLWLHHEATLTTWIGTCPVCSKTGERFKDDIFYRIQAALEGKP